MDHVKQFALTPLAVDVVADAPCLEIRDDHLRRIFRKDKSAVQLGHRQQLLISDSNQDLRRYAITPLRGYLGLLMHGKAFRKPARHPAVGGRENVDVAHLMPQRAAPIEIAWLAR